MNYKLLFYFIFFIFTRAYAIEVTEKELLSLSKEKTWLTLIHNENKINKITTKEFYLSKKDPREELLKTLNAYNNFKKYKKDDNHPQCKFPARYFWLSKKLNLANFEEVKPFCKNLNKWKALKETSSISLILVSGYLGNPASTFGHSFIKLNTKNDLENDLFDLSVNFGALVPENENIVKYILKGIFGGYKAGFSDKYFYTQDLVYSHNEFRDMWDYKLNLNSYEQKLILFHLWEVITKKFDYYFLNKNCAYRVSELFELISKEAIIDNARVWYAPIETFHKLEEINENKKIIKNIRYIPSSEKTIYKRFSSLKENEKALVTSLIKSDYKNLANKLKEINIKSKITILNFLLDFEKYQIIKNPERNNKYKRIILIERFKLPISKENKIFIENKSSPAKGNKPSIISTSINYLNNFYYQSVDFTAFAIESIGDNSLDFDELIVGNTSLGYKDNKVFMNYFDLIKIKKLKTIYLPWEENFIPSWSLNIGTKSIYTRKRKNDFFIDSGIGKAFKINENFIFYPFINTSVHSNNPYTKISPNINLNFEISNTKNLISTGVEFTKKHEKNQFVKISSQYKISKNFSIEGNFEKNNYKKAFLRLKLFF